MNTHHLKTTLRYLWRSKLFTLLNVLGLAIGISACWIIYQIADYEHSFDKNIPEADRIYQVISLDQEEGETEISGFGGVSQPAVNLLLHETSGVELVVPMFYRYHNSVKIPNERTNKPKEFDVELAHVTTLPEYFDMIEYRWLAGDKKTALDAPDKIVLTTSKAKEYFGKLPAAEILGRTIIYDDTVSFQISGVVANLDYANSFNHDNLEFRRVSDADLNNDWWTSKSSSDLIFFKTMRGTSPAPIMAHLNTVHRDHSAEIFKKYQYESWYEALPLAEKHFAGTEFSAQTRVASKTTLYGLMAVGGFLLLLACINYINLSTALLPQRAKEIGVHKTLGSTPKHLVYRFIVETFIVTLLAAAFSIVLTFVASKVFEPFLPEGMFEHIHYARMIVFILVLILTISIISGLYPAFLSTQIQTVKILKGQTEKLVGRGGLSFRKGLIVFQFLVAQVFVICAVIIGQQLYFSIHSDLGFDKDAILTVDVPYKVYNQAVNKGKETILKNELTQVPSLRGVSLGDKPMHNKMLMSGYIHRQDTTEVEQSLLIKYIDTAYLNLYGMELLAGRNIHYSDTVSELIITEKALEGYGFDTPQEAIGQLLFTHNKAKAYPIVGVVTDFHQFGVQTEIYPTTLYSRKESLHAFNIKLPRDSKQWPAAIEQIETAWNRVYTDVPFSYKFYDEVIASLYESERNTQTLVNAATGITIFISCLGLFGLATLTALQRTKEIGIRKVLGASVSGIVALLSKDFVKLVLISIVIASPIAWWAMNKWLEDFAYRIEIQWWMFALADLAALIIALLTVSGQAIRAALANPVNSLRDE
ncbi:ABC transporter permease [Sphingobacterium sp. lm-10]|uniref:ABC transporter permease n=1 Tax=Sphingobacterium sp. lm-10 TaxID=2944904 RepID=UPI002020E897|nr:FtsX-like permease family protein [Sphingobacterium sp. lm-10]MCL7988093.1 ABC transporter permease [Sphingobacterium sp. lm-10]